MINKKVPLDQIRWETCAVDEALAESIRKRGVAIAVKVNETEDGYVCVDGRNASARAECSLRRTSGSGLCLL